MWRTGISLIAACTALTSAAWAQAGKTPDLKKTLFDAANGLGMLRTLAQVDKISTLEYWATGTMVVDGRPCRLGHYRASLNYDVPGFRVDFACEPAAGMTPARQIQVAAAHQAWNEKTPGMSATPAPGTASERLLQLWMTPIGIVKAATAAGAATAVSMESGKTVLAFPLDGATVKATLGDLKRTERVEVRTATSVIETVFSEYGDLNEPDLKADVFFPRRIVQRRQGAIMLDLTVTKTNTYNPYVVMPIPDGLEQAAALR